MKWNRRADFEKDFISYCNGAMLASRKQFAGILGMHPENQWIKGMVRKCRKFSDSKYSIYDLSEVYWEDRERYWKEHGNDHCT